MHCGTDPFAAFDLEMFKQLQQHVRSGRVLLAEAIDP